LEPRSQSQWFAAELVERATTASGLGDWRIAVLEAIFEHVPSEDASWGATTPAGGSTHVHLPLDRGEPWTRFAADPARYVFVPALQATQRLGGASISSEVMSARDLDRTPMFSEILRPAGVTATMTVLPQFRGVPTSCIGFGRHGRAARFRPAERELLRDMVNAIGTVEMAFLAQRPPTPSADSPLFARLSPCEQRVAALVGQGFSNKEVAALIGTSPQTVRKQTISVFRKLGARGRSHLAALLK
jgi:DNA-binding CsgD family transcriptional regulator